MGSSDMGCGKDLTEGEKDLVLKEIAKVKTNKQLLCESLKIFEIILQRGNLGLIGVWLNVFSMHDMNRLKKHSNERNNFQRNPAAK